MRRLPAPTPGFTFVEDWDESTRGPFPVQSRFFDGYPRVLLSNREGLWAGYRIREEKQKGRANDRDNDGSPFDSRRVVPAQYTAFALIEPSTENNQRRASVQSQADIREAELAQVKARKAALKAKRDSGDPLSSEDFEFMADLITGRL